VPRRGATPLSGPVSPKRHDSGFDPLEVGARVARSCSRPRPRFPRSFLFSRSRGGVGEPHTSQIQLMVTDVVMPQMSGAELTSRLASVRPDTRVLYMSGYAAEAIGHTRVLDAGTDLLQKPFARDVLAPACLPARGFITRSGPSAILTNRERSPKGSPVRPGPGAPPAPPADLRSPARHRNRRLGLTSLTSAGSHSHPS